MNVTCENGQNLDPASIEEFAGVFGLEQSAIQDFQLYFDLLSKWQRKINLISKATLPDAWRRHFIDSAQLYPLLPKNAKILADIGSGAGFPGLVLSLLVKHNGGPTVHLIESDQRKCVFLSEVNRQTGAGAIIHNARVETLSDLTADVVTARACAPLDRLVEWAVPLLNGSGECLFLKGESVAEELTPTLKRWTMQTTKIPSQTQSGAIILKLKGLTRRHAK